METSETISNTEELQPETTAENNAGAGQDTAGLERLLEEAEQRGYLRGRNERIEQEVMNPLAAPAPADDSGDGDDDETCPSFLAHLRPGFWDSVK